MRNRVWFFCVTGKIVFERTVIVEGICFQQIRRRRFFVAILQEGESVKEKINKPNQRHRVVQYIERKGSITSLEAIREIGVISLSSRISELRRQGVDIVTEWVNGRNRYDEQFRVKKYSIKKEAM